MNRTNVKKIWEEEKKKIIKFVFTSKQEYEIDFYHKHLFFLLGHSWPVCCTLYVHAFGTIKNNTSAHKDYEEFKNLHVQVNVFIVHILDEWNCDSTKVFSDVHNLRMGS